MRFIISFTIFTAVSDICWTETTKEPPKGISQNPRMLINDISAPDSGDAIRQSNALWSNNPATRISQADNEAWAHRSLFREPHSLTKLTKTLQYGFDPFFHRGVFGHFERRPKPVTLVALRRNGLFPRITVRTTEADSKETAELQSSFNEISDFWQDTPRYT